MEIHGFGQVRYSRELGHSRMTTADSTTWITEACALGRRLGEISRKTGKANNSHGTSGWVAEWASALGRDGWLALTLASYTAAGGGNDHVAHAKGQAKTVLARFAGFELEMFNGAAQAA